MKRQHKNYVPKCLKYALSIKEAKSLSKMFNSSDKEIQKLAYATLLNLPVIRHNRKLVENRFPLLFDNFKDFVNLGSFYRNKLLSFISK